MIVVKTADFVDTVVRLGCQNKNNIIKSLKFFNRLEKDHEFFLHFLYNGG